MGINNKRYLLLFSNAAYQYRDNLDCEILRQSTKIEDSSLQQGWKKKTVDSVM